MDYLKSWILHVFLPSILSIALAIWLANGVREGRAPASTAQSTPSGR